MIALLLAAAAAAYLFVLTKGKASKSMPAVEEFFRVVPARVEPEASVDPRPAIDRLLQVRDRLRETGRLDDANAKAVDQLVLELVHGKASS